jgi:hypothetical protein
MSIRQGMHTGNRTVMIVPIHDAYFNYGVSLAYSSLGADYDLVFVCSTAQDTQTFSATFPPSVRAQFSVITLDEAFDAQDMAVIAQKRLWPTVKKFHALFKCGRDYDHAVCVDAETLVLQRRGWTAAAQRILAKKHWYGGGLLGPMVGERATYQHSLLDVSSPQDHAAIARLVGQGEIYTWWWDLPVYDCRHLDDFQAWIGWQDRRAFLERLTWFAFDHVVYQAYTVLHRGFQLVRVNGHVHSLEFSNSARVRLVHESIGQVSWVNALAYSQDPEYFRQPQFLAVYHMDRNSFPEFNG